MNTKKTGSVITVLMLGLFACNTEQPTVTEEELPRTVVKCDRACLERFADRYIDAMVNHDPSGIPFVTDIRRRHVLVDEERGMVFSFAALDHAGNVKQVTTTDGQTHDIGQLSPMTLYGGGLFKIIDGKIHRIYTVFFSAPYGMKHGW